MQAESYNISYEVAASNLRVHDVFVAQRDLVARVVEPPKFFCGEWLVKWQSIGLDNRKGEMHYRSCPATLVTVIA